MGNQKGIRANKTTDAFGNALGDSLAGQIDANRREAQLRHDEDARDAAMARAFSGKPVSSNAPTGSWSPDYVGEDLSDAGIKNPSFGANFYRFKTSGPAIDNNSPPSSSIPVFDLSAESAQDDHDNIVYGDELPVASLEPKLQHVLVPGKRLSWFEKYISYPINEYIVSPVVNFLSGSNAALSTAPYYAPITVRPESLAVKLNYASVPDISRMNTLQQYRAASEFANQPKGTIFTADQVQNVGSMTFCVELDIH